MQGHVPKHHLTHGTAALRLLGCTGGHPLSGLSTNLLLVGIPSCHSTHAAFPLRVTGSGMFSDLLGNTQRDFLLWLFLCLVPAPVLSSRSLMQIRLVFSCNSSTHHKWRNVLHLPRTAHSTRPLSMSRLNFCWLPQTGK